MIRVSVIITTFNSEKYLGSAINSVLSQTFNDFEIIVIDDGSDTTAGKDIVSAIKKSKKNHIIYKYQNNKGPASARNKGLLISSGEYVAFLDSDDLYRSNKLAIQVSLLDQLDKTYAFIAGGGRKFSDNNKKKKIMLPKNLDGRCYCDIINKSANIIGTGTQLFRKSAIDDIGGYDESLWRNEDIDLLVRLSYKYKFKTHKDIVLEYRTRPDSLSNKDIKSSLENCGKFVNKLYVLNYNIPRKMIIRRLQRSYFSCAYQYLINKNDFKSFQHYFFKGIRKTGPPKSWRAWLAFCFASTGPIGAYLFRLIFTLKRRP